MSRSQLSKTRKKQRKQRRQKDREKRSRQLAGPTLSRKLSERVDLAYELAEEGQLDEAAELLERIDRRGVEYYQVVEALLFVSQQRKDHLRSYELADRLTVLRPRDAEARLMFAQESLHCDYATIALANYRIYLENWPEHSHVPKIRQLIDVLQEECDRRIKAVEFPAENGFDWCVMHETSLALLQRNRFSECAEKCRELLALVPRFGSARNNLAVACFQDGHSEEAVSVTEETRRLVPENRFAEVLLAKLYFLTGREQQANRIADEIVADPPTHQDALVGAFELLAFLGRDEELAELCDGCGDFLVDDYNKASRLHFMAYVQHRQGKLDQAKKCWQKLKKLNTKVPEAEQNQDDLSDGIGHAPWANSFTKWIPQSTMDRIADRRRRGDAKASDEFARFAFLVPALLDRGDLVGREFALRLAMAEGSPAMIDALKSFALGTRGPDSLRAKALMFLNRQQAVGPGPHRVFSSGCWTEVQLLNAEIYDEAKKKASDSPEVLEWIADGIGAMHEGDYDRAEALFEKVLEREPGNVNASFNRCTVWIRRDGSKGIQRARPLIQQLHQDHPEYIFARAAVAQIMAGDGEIQKARELLAPVYQQDRLHVSEAIALFSAQAEICFADRDTAGVERAISMLTELGGEGNPSAIAWRQRLNRRSSPILENLLRRLI